MGSACILDNHHLLTYMWRHASAECLLLSDKHTTLPGGPGNFQLPQPTVAPNTHLLILGLLLKYIHLVLHACLSTVRPQKTLGLLLGSFCAAAFVGKEGEDGEEPQPLRCFTNKHHHRTRPALKGFSNQNFQSKVGRTVAHGWITRQRTVAHGYI